MTDFRPINECYWVEPGRLLAGEHPGHWDPSVVRRRMTALLDAGIRLFVDLSEPADAVHPYKAILEKVCRDRGIYAQYLSVPLRENAVPEHMEDVVFVLGAIHSELISGGRAYLHCSDGVGRTGMVVGCWLVERGCDRESALDELASRFAAMNKASKFRSTPSSAPQADWVERWIPQLGLGNKRSRAS